LVIVETIIARLNKCRYVAQTITDTLYIQREREREIKRKRHEPNIVKNCLYPSLLSSCHEKYAYTVNMQFVV